MLFAVSLAAAPARATCEAGPAQLKDAVTALFAGGPLACDVNGDGTLSAADLVAIQRTPATPTASRTVATATETPGVGSSPTGTATATVTGSATANPTATSSVTATSLPTARYRTPYANPRWPGRIHRGVGLWPAK